MGPRVCLWPQPITTLNTMAKGVPMADGRNSWWIHRIGIVWIVGSADHTHKHTGVPPLRKRYGQRWERHYLHGVGQPPVTDRSALGRIPG